MWIGWRDSRTQQAPDYRLVLGSTGFHPTYGISMLSEVVSAHQLRIS